MGLTAQEIANIAKTIAIQANGAALSDADRQKANSREIRGDSLRLGCIC